MRKYNFRDHSFHQKANKYFYRMGVSHILLAIFWIAYCVLHSVLAGIPLKNKLRERLGKNYKYYRPFYVVLSFLLLVLIIYFQVRMKDVELFRINGTILLAGIVICFSGLVLMVICIQKYFISLSGLKSLFGEKPAGTLMISGIHRYVRHPLYLGTFIFIWGLMFLLPYASLLISNIIITGYTLIGIRLEENKLIHEYGEDYRKFMDQVPMILPFGKPGRH